MIQSYIEEQEMKTELYIDNDAKEELPLIVLNTFEEAGQRTFDLLKERGQKDFLLLCISDLNWNDDLSPWYLDPIFKKEPPFAGKADQYLEVLLQKILPEKEEYITSVLHKKITYCALTGYSLAGLFALYAATKTSRFKRVVSASGSLWFPGFSDYLIEHGISENIDRVYLSLGDKEALTRHELMSQVKTETLKTYEYLKDRIDCIFEENEGNHFKDEDLRVCKGIEYILK